MLPAMKIATRRFSPTNHNNNNNNNSANGGYPACPLFFYQQVLNNGRNGFNYNAKADVDGCLKQQQIQLQQTQLHNVTGYASSSNGNANSSNSGSYGSSSSLAGGGINGSLSSPDFENNQQLFLQTSQHQQSRMAGIFGSVAAASSCPCCLPTGCLKGVDDSVFLERTDDGGGVQAKNGIPLRCSNLLCQELKWMHLECFQEWQTKLQCLVTSPSPRRTRHLSDKDAFPHHHGLPWGKRDLDPEARLCTCRCGKGNLRFESGRPTLESLPDSKSLTNGCLASPSPSASHWDRKFSFSQRDGLTGLGTGSSAPFCQQVLSSPSCRLSSPPFSASGLGSGNFFNESFMQQLFQGFQQQQQQQQQSNAAVSQYLQLHSLQQNPLPSSGSGLAPGGIGIRKQRGSTSSTLSSSRMFEFFADRSKAAAGNIFRRRTDMTSFDILPKPSRNSYNVRVEDEGPYGNDETRCFLLTALSSFSRTTVKCVVCRCDLAVYDKYPLIDGTFFLSPESYDGCGLDVTHQNRRMHHHHHHHQAPVQQQQFLNAVCIECAHGTHCQVSCLACGSLWRGNALVIGTMYNYDVFAAMSCCSTRLTCARCGLAVREVPAKPATSSGNPVVSSVVNTPSFSDFCRSIACPRCNLEACHAVKPLPTIFKINVAQNQ